MIGKIPIPKPISVKDFKWINIVYLKQIIMIVIEIIKTQLIQVQ